jgi:uncharacterized protein YndB with AHSA1/START domain
MKLAQAIDWQVTEVHKPAGSGQLTLVRTIGASAQRVFDAFADPQHLAAWWGPDGFSLTTHTFAWRTGGHGFWTLTMHGHGQHFPNHLVWDALEPGQRVAYHHVAVGGDAPMHMATEVLFEPISDAVTRTTWTMDFGSAAARDAIDAQMMASQGGQQTTARLANYVQGTGYDEAAARMGYCLTIERDMPLSPRAIFRCWTEPELMKHWFCPKPWFIDQVQIDLRPGGGSSMEMHGPNGEMHPNPGSYLVVEPDRRLVFTDLLLSDWRPNPDASFGFTGSIGLEPLSNGLTRYTAIARHRSEDSRASHAAMGFHDGWGICADQLVAFAQAQGLQ